ncbi:hypothetical protein ATY41_06865 [Leifsonia xyli subsp. xyli]|uniref:Secreted protein n=1 Tax=Leifsonia xyli subsp. xyli TaxID=59736 RepID=A0A1E2SK06_LEIXY|nr:hypothetical protein ATY41_11535 [Leifsonia xyli subsp. xyli]ODA91103.1 hypothetical protein ATY41_06865 [Leifsonia xyli subsp. xyli]
MVSAVIAAILAVGLGGSLSASATEPDRGAGDPTQDHAGSTLAHDDSMLARDGSSQECGNDRDQFRLWIMCLAMM